MELRDFRKRLKISQSRLAQVAAVSRFKIAVYELGEGTLTPDERSRIMDALRSEASRIQGIAADVIGQEVA